MEPKYQQWAEDRERQVLANSRIDYTKLPEEESVKADIKSLRNQVVVSFETSILDSGYHHTIVQYLQRIIRLPFPVPIFQANDMPARSDVFSLFPRLQPSFSIPPNSLPT